MSSKVKLDAVKQNGYIKKSKLQSQMCSTRRRGDVCLNDIVKKYVIPVKHLFVYLGHMYFSRNTVNYINIATSFNR